MFRNMLQQVMRLYTRIVLLCCVLVVSISAHALISTVNNATLNSAFDDATHKTSWTSGEGTQQVTFTLAGTNKAIYSTFGLLYIANGPTGLIPQNTGSTFTISWNVGGGYDIEVSNVTMNVVKASGAQSYITIGDGARTGDLHWVITADVSTGTKVYTTEEYVPVIFEKAFSWSTVEVRSITITYTLIPKFIYDGSGDGVGDPEKLKWEKADNWLHDETPTIANKVWIRHDVVIATEVSAYSMTIENGSKVTIAPTGSLKIGAGGIIGATTENFKLQAATSGTTMGQTGILRIDPAFTGAMPNATVELFSKAYFDMTAGDRNNAGSYQYVGSPMSAGTAAKTVFTNSWVYNWDEPSGTWKNNRKTLTLQPFVGYATSQYMSPEGILITQAGQLASKGNAVLPLTYTASSAEPGVNVFANSYTAPIDITMFEDGDFSTGVEKTIYLFNTGSKNDVEAHAGDLDGDAAGQYIAIPIHSAGTLVGAFQLPAVIPSMQGFYVKTGQAGTLTLNYERLVWNATHGNTSLRAPQRANEEGSALCVTLSADGWSDKLYLLESDNYDAAYENGTDARKMMRGNLNIFSIEQTDTLAVDATHSIKGTRVGVRTGEETAYTISFSHIRNAQDWVLEDSETGTLMDIIEGGDYTFFAEPNSVLTDRFRISERSVPAITTDVRSAQTMQNVHKFIRNGELLILKDGVLYNAMGAVVCQ